MQPTQKAAPLISDVRGGEWGQVYV